MGLPAVASGSQGQDDAGGTLRVLLDALSELSLARTLEEVQSVVGNGARRLLRADGATFVLRDGDECVYTEEDAIAPLWKGLRMPVDRCISGWSMVHREAVAIEDVYTDQRIPHDVYRPTFVKSLLMVPVRRADPLAAIGIYWGEAHRANDDEISLAQALADSCAVAMEYIRLLGELAQTVEISSTDDLTGIANRRAWDRTLRGALEVGQSVTMMLIDLDRFKQFNDSYGHQAGDALLRDCAAAWGRALRETDLLARYGGEEFAILLPDVSLDHACQVAERVRLATPQPVTASVGVAHSLPLESVSALTARADAALYRSKRDGRNQVSVAD